MRRPTLPASRAGRALVKFWAALLALALLGIGTLQWLGPPLRPPASMPGATPSSRTVPGTAPPHAKAPANKPPVPVAAPPAGPGRHAIPAPDPALLEPLPHEAGAGLPRIAADGRQARLLYAAVPPVVAAGTPRVAILLDGIGLSEADSLDAIARLPPAVSLAVSPYATAPGAVLSATRTAGHELLLSLPMEPGGAPADDEGGRALSEQVAPDENRARLRWALSRVAGYAGVTNAFVGMGGERFTPSQQFEEVAAELGRRGLFYLDATPGTAPPAQVASVAADLRLDDPPTAAVIDRALQQLEQVARRNGSAIGVAGPLHPLTIEHLSDWAHALALHGLVLVPVSSLVHTVPPAKPPAGGKHEPG